LTARQPELVSSTWASPLRWAWPGSRPWPRC